MTAAYGFPTQLGIDTTTTPSKRYDFAETSIIARGQLIDTNGLRGTRTRDISRIRTGNRGVAGTIHLQPTALELSYLLPWILGTPVSGNTFALSDTIPTRNVLIDRQTKVNLYNGCVVDACTIRGSQGMPLDVILDVCGIDEATWNAGTFPSLTLDTTTQPFIFTDGVFLLNGTTVSSRDIEITIQNNVDRNRFFNSQTATALIAMDRHIGVTALLPYGDHQALYNAGNSGVQCTCTFTNGGTSLAFTFVKLAYPQEGPTLPGHQEQMLPIRGSAYGSYPTLEMVTVLDSVP